VLLQPSSPKQVKLLERTTVAAMLRAAKLRSCSLPAELQKESGKLEAGKGTEYDIFRMSLLVFFLLQF